MKSTRGAIDLLVIGGGTAGIVGAKTAAQLGARTVLAERSRTGGDCLWTGCIPSKTLLAEARGSASKRAVIGSSTDFSAVRARIAEAIVTIAPDDSPESLTAAGVTVLHGTVRFTAPGEAEIDGTTVRFHQALIATGSDPAMPGIPGLESARTVTSESVWDLDQLPGRLVVIGGGPLGCELGQAFARLGSQVALVARSGILTREDLDAAALVRESLVNDGVHVVEHTEIDRVSARRDGSSTVHTCDGHGLDADVVLVAAGRIPRTADLGLETVAVERDDTGHVVVDSRMRTSHPSIWAAGDVTPYPEFTHLAGVHGSTAASNAVLGLRRTVSDTVPRVTYTFPELAAVGITVPTDPTHTTSTIHHDDTDRAVTEHDTRGMARIVVDKRGRILGGTVVGPRAGESLAELTLAVQQRLTTRDLTATTHPYPTYSDALWNAAIAHTRSTLSSPLARASMKALVTVNRWRSRRAGR